MKLSWLAVCLVLVSPGAGRAQHAHAGHAAHEGRKIKGLSAEELDGYLHGEGMGMALAAELNGYPGPRHVLQRAGELGLSEAQAAAVRRAYEAMHARAVELGTRIVELERTLDGELADRTITGVRLDSLTDEIGRLRGRLRAVHLRAHLELRDLLSDAQRGEYYRTGGRNGS